MGERSPRARRLLGGGGRERGPAWDQRARAAEHADRQDLFAEVVRREDPRRRALIAELKSYIQAGVYVPNLRLTAERMLADLG